MTALGLVMSALGLALVWSGVAGQSIADVVSRVVRGEPGVSHSQDAWTESQRPIQGPISRADGTWSGPRPQGWVPGQDTGNIVQ